MPAWIQEMLRLLERLDLQQKHFPAHQAPPLAFAAGRFFAKKTDFFWNDFFIRKLTVKVVASLDPAWSFLQKSASQVKTSKLGHFQGHHPSTHHPSPSTL